ncbi:hypothetical protein [Dyella acidisoli]|uniref:hypothetical protein n=1 Tax=Dyella acidisoli TaxID=1867834 RepID=UPI0024E0D1F3|nr:hypothetical protein [Dyella acidisoli]
MSQQHNTPHFDSTSKTFSAPHHIFRTHLLGRTTKKSQVIPTSAEKVPEAVGTAKRDWTPPV